ncbi:hypothetical protein [Nodosilinea sp. E11]|uniref:hypothetical protein n=1 Tax=Nodosilinea sp. E11 TaxID=3037479 RepID=UPI002934A469|nr:hypothetical protein [Nodosilinea sp. E11]WOD37287.1 hypothetical protein RRF56_02045 [Nodosilinea sp. E11]
MKITTPHVEIDHPYTLLVLTIDGKTHRLLAEKKPTLTRHGIVAVTGYSAKLPDGTTIEGSDDPNLFRLWLAFALDMYQGRDFQSGLLDPMEFSTLEAKLEPYALPGAKPMIDYLPEVDD